MITKITIYDEFLDNDLSFIEIKPNDKILSYIEKAQRLLLFNQEFEYIFINYYPEQFLNSEKKESEFSLTNCGFKIYKNDIYFLGYLKNTNILCETDSLNLKNLKNENLS